jgi:acetylornithine deacetylase/succinyl-diaminopimelate desuccinylase-like protein
VDHRSEVVIGPVDLLIPVEQHRKLGVVMAVRLVRNVGVGLKHGGEFQPPGDATTWASPPYAPVARGGRLYGRGTADDKAGIALHAAVARAFDGRPPVRVRILIEGEEEIGSPHLDRFLELHASELASDVIVIADNPNWRLGVPSLTTSLRGLIDCVVEVRVLDHAVHSGEFGGPVVDAIASLARLLATLHDDTGNPAVEGVSFGAIGGPELDQAEFRSLAGVRPGIQLAGAGPLTERLWSRPAISALGIDAPTDAANQIVPAAWALVSVRLAPDDDPAAAMEALQARLQEHAPWGGEVRITAGRQMMGPGAVLDTRGAHYDIARSALADAWGERQVAIGGGEAIQIVMAFSQAFPQASLLLTGVADPWSRLHAENESVDLGELERGSVAEALLLSRLAAVAPSAPT